MNIRSVSHVGLTVSDFERSVRWYSEMFGFKLVSEQILDEEQVSELYSLYELDNNSIRLGFLRGRKGGVIEIFEFQSSLPAEHMTWNRPGPTHITLDVKNVKRWYRDLKDRGVEFCTEPQVTDGNEWIFLKDPDGNLIELIDLKHNYYLIRALGGIAGWFMARGKFKEYYLEAGDAR